MPPKCTHNKEMCILDYLITNMAFKIGVILLFYLANGVHSLNNGLALTPPMGWMHWQRFRCLTDCVAYPDECIRYVPIIFPRFP